MANISGLPLIEKVQQNPMKTTTYGTGELIRNALEKGCQEFIVGIGGSATNDAGTGMLQALGFQFQDKNGDILGQGGEILEKIASVCTQNVHKSLKNAHFIVACDVQNPFYGPNGAAAVYARQKGADDSMIEKLDQGMRSFSQVIQHTTGKDISQIPGSGAAGGMGGGMLAFFNAELRSGADLLLDLSQFESKIENADLIITGEGRIDRQSLMGKIPGKILEIGKRKGIPVIAIAGCLEDEEILISAGFKGIFATKPDSITLEEAMEPGIAQQNIKSALASAHLEALIG
jgi:glycerate kinase